MNLKQFAHTIFQRTPPEQLRELEVAHLPSRNVNNKCSPIIGHRMWMAEKSPEQLLLLKSVSNDYVWPPFEPAKGEPKIEHQGVYAFNTDYHVYRQLEMFPAVWGQVALWGNVAIHEFGY